MIIPVISLADNPDAPREISNSLAQFGFAVLDKHANEGAIDELYQSWGSFFNSPQRFDFCADAESQNGYFSSEQAETAKGSGAQDLKEYFQYRPHCRLPAALKAPTENYFNGLLDLGKTVLGWIQSNTPGDLWRNLSEPLNSYLDPEQTMLRILRYPPLSGDEHVDSIRAAAHEDINFITLLPAASKPGLEIKPRGEDWSSVDAPPGSIIINIGDMLQELTRGALPSTTHRVVNLDGEDARVARLSAPVFCHPLGDLILSERYTARQYLSERLAEINPEGLIPSSKVPSLKIPN